MAAAVRSMSPVASRVALMPTPGLRAGRLLSGRDRYELVPAPGNGGDVSPALRMALQLDPQVADVAVDDVALRDVVGTPQAVQDFIARQQASRIGGEQIEQVLLERGEMQLRLAEPDAMMHDVDLELAQPKDRSEHGGFAIRASHDRDDARHQFIGRERDREDVVHAAFE